MVVPRTKGAVMSPIPEAKLADLPEKLRTRAVMLPLKMLRVFLKRYSTI
jgi:hypothetical protein